MEKINNLMYRKGGEKLLPLNRIGTSPNYSKKDGWVADYVRIRVEAYKIFGDKT